MSKTLENEIYLDIEQLAKRAQLSKATLWRLKKAGKISFCQPGGKGHSVRFPHDAIEQAMNPSVSTETKPGNHLSGPLPKWQQ